jgi:SAM-dependent methyltransferase
LPHPPPSWQLPPGVTRGLWDYTSAEHIAWDYDEYFAYNRLFEFDEEILKRHFRQPGLVVDLGCGTGRALVPLVRLGHRGVAVDLSIEMLSVVSEKARIERLPINCIRANLVELDCLGDSVADYAICLFSTLGMIRGSDNRQRTIKHIRRILKPDGIFILHVHNFWYNLFDPGGPWWVLKSLILAPFKRGFDLGDKYFDYRGIPKMFLHVFRRSELVRLLKQGGFRIRELIPLDYRRTARLTRPWFLGSVRANGWIVVCECYNGR